MPASDTSPLLLRGIHIRGDCYQAGPNRWQCKEPLLPWTRKAAEADFCWQIAGQRSSMIQDLAVGAGTLLPSGPHDEFLELCAVSTSGQLSEEEQNRLKEHLAICTACREALHEYESVVNDAIPAIGAEQSTRIDPGPGFSQSRAEKAFFDRLAKEEGYQPGAAEKKSSVPSAFR